MSRRALRILVIVVALITGVIVLPRVILYLRIDSCQNRGGSWDAEVGACAHVTDDCVYYE